MVTRKSVANGVITLETDDEVISHDQQRNEIDGLNKKQKRARARLERLDAERLKAESELDALGERLTEEEATLAEAQR